MKVYELPLNIRHPLVATTDVNRPSQGYNLELFTCEHLRDSRLKTMSTLVLIVGTNPLPNYIVAKYLYSCQKTELTPSHVLLICTAQTHAIAERLKHIFEDELKADVLPLHQFDDPFDLGKRKALKICLSALPEIHLNYTGGTKAMGIQVYQLVKEVEKPARFKYSYLSASDNLLRFDDGGFEPKDQFGSKGDMRREVLISLETIRSLHNCKIDDENSSTEYPELGSWLFDKLILKQDKTLLKDFQGWINSIKKDDKIEPILTEYPWLDSSEFKEFADLVKTNRQLMFNKSDDYTWDSLEKKDRERLVKYLHGAWLERPVYELLISLNTYNPPLTLGKFDEKIKRIDAKKGMQLDAVLIRGYELAVISMTTSTKEDILKQKAFEVLHRAEQLGGEEAKAIVVALVSDQTIIDKVRDDLRNEFGAGAKFNFKILGSHELIKLHKGELEGDFIFTMD